jgi:PilZ domain
MEAPMPQPQQEKRATRRFSLRLPLSVKFDKTGTQQAEAETRDVSARGVCFYMGNSIAPGSEIEFTLTLPPEITLTESIRVRCVARVVRLDEQAAEGQIGIAAVIDRYEFLGES